MGEDFEYEVYADSIYIFVVPLAVFSVIIMSGLFFINFADIIAPPPGKAAWRNLNLYNAAFGTIVLIMIIAERQCVLRLSVHRERGLVVLECLQPSSVKRRCQLLQDLRYVHLPPRRLIRHPAPRLVFRDGTVWRLSDREFLIFGVCLQDRRFVAQAAASLTGTELVRGREPSAA